MKACICGGEIKTICEDIQYHWLKTGTGKTISMVEDCEDAWRRESESSGL